MKHNFFLKIFRIFVILAISIQSLSPAVLVSSKPVFANENSDSSPSDSNSQPTEVESGKKPIETEITLDKPSSPSTETSTEISEINSTQSDAQNPSISTESDLAVSIVNNPLTTTLDSNLDSPVQTESATVSTNKSDYSPTDTVIIYGSNFNSLSQYTIQITSDDSPAVNFSSKVETTFDGNFTFLYPLDGIYRPNYQLFVKNLAGETVASTSFTDAATTVTLTAATGGSAIGSATNTSDGTAVWTTLTGPSLSEDDKGNIGTGTIILSVPNGFVFDTTGTAPSVLLTGDATANKNINNTSTGNSISLTSISSTALTLSINSKSSGTIPNTLTWQNVRVRPTVTSPLSSGNLTKSGISAYSIFGSSTNYGTLTEVDTTLPTGQIAINSNATYTTTRSVALNFSGVSPDVTQIQLRNGTVGSFQTAISFENPHVYILPDNGDGDYTVSVRFIDSSSNQSSGVISDSIILDTAFPSTTINSVTDGNNNTVNSGGLTKSNSVSVDFSASDTNGIASSECKIDSGSYSACSSTKSYSGLSDGSHTVSVRSTDSAGNVESTATFSWNIDASAPTLDSKSTYSGWYNSNQTSTFTFSDNGGSGIVSGTPVACTISTEGSNQTCSVTPNVCDLAGNCNTTTVTSNGADIDKSAPNTPSASPVAGDYTSDQSVTLSSSDATSSLLAIYYTTDETAPDNTKTLYSGPITVDKDMTIKVIAYDNAGNTSEILTAAYGVAPIISAESSSAVSSSATTITWTTDDPATSRVIYDTVSHGDSTSTPNYGYANSTTEADTSPKVTSHSVSVSVLSAGTTYYFRTVSHGSPEAVSSEKSFTTSSSSSDSTGSVAGSSTSSSNSSATVCSGSKPGSAPVLLSAVAGQNSITLTWSKASDPVTYYLITYGLSAGAQTYGNPDVGDSNTTSYTVGNLAGGTPYFFKVRAGNGCTPGDFSNELSATSFGGTVSAGQIATGFSEGVLGTASPSAAPATELPVLGVQNEKIAKKSPSKTTNELLKNWWIIILIIIFLLVLFFFLRHRKNDTETN